MLNSSIWTVSQLVKFIKKQLENQPDLQTISVQGEISNFTAHRSGHWYFSLKDQNARCQCVMFANAAKQVPILPKDGDQVILLGSVSVFEASGQMQLYVNQLFQQGLGQLYIQLENLRKKLTLEGMFDASRKKSIPQFPFNIGVITSLNTAAFQDVISTIQRRWPVAQISHFHTAVQGEGSITSIVQALANADQSQCDVLLLVRGGGSIEDLWSFNEEAVVRAIDQCKTPLITGIGHQSDRTLCDEVADQRAPTPTGAAEMATPVLDEVTIFLLQTQQRLLNRWQHLYSLKESQIQITKDSRFFKNMDYLLRQPRMQIQYVEQFFDHSLERIKYKQSQWVTIEKQFWKNTKAYLEVHQENRDKISQALPNFIDFRLSKEKEALQFRQDILNSLSPLAVLKRGYSVIYKQSKIVQSVSDVDINDSVSIRLQDGVAQAEITAIQEETWKK